MRMRAAGTTLAACALALSVLLGSCAGSGTAPKGGEESAASEAPEEAPVADDEAAKAAEEAQQAAEEAQALEKEHADARAAAESDGLSVFTGTVRVMDGAELCEYEGVDPAMNGDPDVVAESTYVILVLDGTEHVVGMGADGSPREGDADHIGIGKFIPAFSDFEDDSVARWADHDGERVCVAGSPWFQTDVSLPFAPRMFDAELLYTE